LASNAWVLVSKMFKDAAGAKQRDLRVRSDNPAAGVAPPEHGDRKAKVYLYPSEFETLVGCAGIDLRFLTVYAVAVYTYMRAGELEALTRDDVDLEHGVIQINKAIDRETGRVKSTKSGETRRIPIEPNIAPLLERLCHGRSGEQPVLWMPDNEDRAVMLRQHLEQAGVKRADLFADNDRQKHVTFHDLRATGITWMAVRGDDPLRIKQRAGHSSFSTTEMYIREVENLVAGFGAPFPSLPKELVGRSANRPGIVRNERSPRNDKWSNGGSKPASQGGSQRIAEDQGIRGTGEDLDPPDNPPDPRRPDPARRLPDDSPEHLRVAALTRAARALVGVDDALVRDILDQLLRTLEGDGQVVSLAGKRTRP
jgi:hypothetical protein